MFRSRRNDDGTVVEETTVEQQREHAWGSPPVVRGLTTLLGVGAAGFLVWLATQFELSDTSDYWAAMGILAGAGACLGLSQLLGGWTKWGAPTFSPGVFFLAFLPTFVAVGGILVATRPTGTAEGDQVAGWIGDIGLGGLAGDLIAFQGVLAFGLGIVLTFTLDTRGPRREIVEEERQTVVADEEIHDYRREGADDVEGAEDVERTEDGEVTVVHERGPS